MGTVPTKHLEDALRSLYLRWLRGLPIVADDQMQEYIEQFRRDADELIATRGAEVVARADMAGFPSPQVLPLDVDITEPIQDMKLAAVAAGIGAGVNPKDVARNLFRIGVQKSYNDLERLARTEAIQAYWRSSWDQVQGLDMVMVWSAEESSRTCSACLAKDGLVVEDPSIRDHPNGRCTLLPKMPQNVPLRSKERNPAWTRDHKDDYPLPQDPAYRKAFTGGPRKVLQNRAVQQAVAGMVSQGWSSGEAFQYMQAFPGMAYTSTIPGDKSLVLRQLESTSQHVWDGLKPAPVTTLHRGGEPGPLGISSWTTNQRSAERHSLRNGGETYSMKLPKNLLVYDLYDGRDYLVFGQPRTTVTTAKGRRREHIGVMDAPTTQVTAERAATTLNNPR